MTTTVTGTNFLLRFPEFTGAAPDPTVAQLDTLLIPEAVRQINESGWGTRFDDGVNWLTAHLARLFSDGAGGGTGAVESKTVSKLKITRKTSSALADDALATTKYGIYYLGLRRLVFVGRAL